MAHSLNIILLLNERGRYEREVLYGISDFMQQRPAWIPHVVFDDHPMREARRFAGADGIIAMVASMPEYRKLAVLARHVVSIGRWIGPDGPPLVGNDDHAIGEMAAEHLLDRGYRLLGCYTRLEGDWAQQRIAGYERRIAFSNAILEQWKTSGNPQTKQRPLRRWLRDLPKPLAVWTISEQDGWDVLSACHLQGLRVPEDVAVLGCDNSELMCRMARPPLSSISLNTQRIGREAAAQLDRLLSGQLPTQGHLQIPPLGVDVRASTDLLAVGDEEVAAAMRYIRQLAPKPLTVTQVAEHVLLSVTSLERRFMQSLRRTPREEIRRVRMDLARGLLANPDTPLKHVARTCGFAHPQHFAAAFRKCTGYTPSQYRDQFRRLRPHPSAEQCTGSPPRPLRARRRFTPARYRHRDRVAQPVRPNLSASAVRVDAHEAGENRPGGLIICATVVTRL